MKIASILLLLAIATVSGSYGENDFEMNTFAHTFSSILLADPEDRKVFDIADSTGKEIGPKYQKVMTEYNQNVGLKNAKELGEKLGVAIADQLHKITPEDHVLIVGYNLANQLKVSGYLDGLNAEQRGKFAAADFHEAFRMVDKSEPEGKIKGILEGYKAALKRYGLNLTDCVKTLIDNVVNILEIWNDTQL